MCIDQWVWKTDAPEFVPDSMKGFGGGCNDYAGGVYPEQGAWTMSPMPAQQSGRGIVSDNGGGAGSPGDNTRLGQLRLNLEWQRKMKEQALREMQTRMNQLEVETAQIQASWENERSGLMRQIKHHRAVLERYCIPIEEAGNMSYSEGQDEGNGSYLSGFEPSAPSQWADAQGLSGAGCKMSGHYGGDGSSVPAHGSNDTQGSSLDSKMRQLNNLLQEKTSHGQKYHSSPDGTANGEASISQADEAAGNTTNGDTGAITSTLRAMFPHATIRTGQDQNGDDYEETGEEVQRVEQYLRKLETVVGRQVDERAMRALQALNAGDALEALGKVEELVNSQGGHCRNLSSILQSLCRKIEKKRYSKGSKNEEERMKQGSGSTSREVAGLNLQRLSSTNTAVGVDTKRSGHARKPADAIDTGVDSDGLGNDYGLIERPHSGEDRDRPPIRRSSSMESDVSKLNTPSGRRNNRKSWADIQSGDEEDPRDDSNSEGNIFTSTPTAAGEEEAEQAASEPWTPRRMEKAARRGLELKRRSAGGSNGEGGNAWGGWELKIGMSGLQPPLTEAGMERYCSWLCVRLTSFRDEHGAEALRRCRGEVDFSHNKLTDQMVWMLLETLAQHEVHIALLKLFANNISQGGVLAICEFIRMNERADALQELHLSHNEIDDESALELLRTLHFQRPRYPPKRAAEGTGEMVLAPVWLRLNHNRVRDPTAVRLAAEAEGIAICSASDRNVCGTSRCGQLQCPLVHLYSFDTQS